MLIIFDSKIEFYTVCKFTVKCPGSIPDGKGYIEFVKSSYSVQSNQTHAKVRLRRRGSYGRIKKTEIFTRDLSGKPEPSDSYNKCSLAEEGRDYFCSSNDMGVLHFGSTDIYKEVKVRINKSRGLAERAFKLELGNNEGINDMKRQFETQINIKPVSYQIGYESDDMSDNDIESIQESAEKQSFAFLN